MGKGVNGANHLQPAAATQASIASELTNLGATHPMPGTLHLTSNEADRLLRIISQAWRIRRHYDLFQWLQAEVQHFIPHQILISAWGDFQGANLGLDVISALPGVRTGRRDGCDIDAQFKALYVRWLSRGRQPVVLENAADIGLMRSGCDCALHKSLQGMQSVLVHGIHDARDGIDTLYLAAHSGSIVANGSVERFCRLIDPILAQIDIAFRRVAGLQFRDVAANAKPLVSVGVLSAREEEILMWISVGRTNAEIAEILDISAFTVKNHVQRIIKKLDATNRTEAAAKYRRNRRPMRSNNAGKSAALVAE